MGQVPIFLMFREALGSFVFVGFDLSRDRTTIVTEGDCKAPMFTTYQHPFAANLADRFRAELPLIQVLTGGELRLWPDVSVHVAQFDLSN